MNGKIERYDALDGLRVLSMFGILVMHVLANITYRQELEWLYRYVVCFADFTALFMALSAFSISCGYYERIKDGGFQAISKFYERRYSKILPFFFFLTLVDVVMGFSVASLFEGVANTTLLFSLIPHEQISVIGVGWTLGVIFLFYILYPFFVFCMADKVRFSILYGISVFFAFISNQYFGLGKVDFLYCLIYFVTGCGAYLWRESICKVKHWILWIAVLLTTILFFVDCEFHAQFKYLFVTSLLFFAMNISGDSKILASKPLKYLSRYSFEVYLSHMVAYRLLERVGALRLFDNALVSYGISCILVFIISFGIAVFFQFFQTTWRLRRKNRQIL